MPDRDQDVIQPAPGQEVIVDLVGGDDLRAASLCHRGSAFQDPWILGPHVMVQLAEDALFAQRGLDVTQPRLAVGWAEIEEVTSMFGHGGERRPRFALRLVGVGETEQPAQVRVALEVARDEDQLVPIHLEGAADDGFDAELAAGLEVTDRPVDAAAVGEGEGGHLELGGAHGKLGRMRATVQEREVGVAVELDVRRHRSAF